MFCIFLTFLILVGHNCVHGDQEQPLEVRKCCEEDEYWDTDEWNCTASKESNFKEQVVSLVEASTEITYKTGGLIQCPNSLLYPNQYGVTSQSYSILLNGHLKSHVSGMVYDHEHYCTELFGIYSEGQFSGKLMAKVCPRISKCSNMLVDVDHLDLGNITNFSYKNSAFSDAETVYDTLSSKNSKSLITISSNETFQGRIEGTICDYSDNCFPSFVCCEESPLEDNSGAYKCQEVFNKCCPPSEIWSGDGCVAKNPDFSPSHLMTSIMESHFSKTAQPSPLAGLPCNIVLKKEYIHWWINDNGTLGVRAHDGGNDAESLNTKNYCVEDYIDEMGETDSMVMMCLEDAAHVLPEQYAKGYPVGKCCPHGQYLERDNITGFPECVAELDAPDILQLPEFVSANITELVYTDYPKCDNHDYFIYRFGEQKKRDYATIFENQTMGVVVVDEKSGCNFTIEKLRNTEYCIENIYKFFSEDSADALIFVCDTTPGKRIEFKEVYIIVPVLMLMSCAALAYTAYFLISMRVRRGTVTVKKINTLAGRILLSYVMSYFTAFLLFAISNLAIIPNDNPICYIIAGASMFFMLAAFLWNTSICLEPLLLVLDVKVPENYRLVCHCLWAWGIPGIITAVAFTLDHYREDLSCSVVTPKFGLNTCFISDDKAKLLYLYVPMCISLVANCILLLASNLERRAKLKQLERGMGPNPLNVKDEELRKNYTTRRPNEAPKPNAKPQHSSGLRKYENKNVWAQSGKLVFWAGVTWILELATFLVNYYDVNADNWAKYMWYLPTAINCLRGVGIFFIIAYTPEVRKKLHKKIQTICPAATSPKKEKLNPSSSKSASKADTDNRESISRDETSANSEPETTVTRL